MYLCGRTRSSEQIESRHLHLDRRLGGEGIIFGAYARPLHDQLLVPELHSVQTLNRLQTINEKIRTIFE